MERITIPADIAAALERARFQVEALAQTADELQNVLPDAVGAALRDGLREEAAPLSRRLAQGKGLLDGTTRRRAAGARAAVTPARRGEGAPERHDAAARAARDGPPRRAARARRRPGAARR